MSLDREFGARPVANATPHPCCIVPPSGSYEVVAWRRTIAGLERRAKPAPSAVPKAASKPAVPKPAAKPSSYLQLHAIRKAREEPAPPAPITPEPVEEDLKPLEMEPSRGDSPYLLPPAPRPQAAPEAASEFLIPHPRVALKPRAVDPRALNPRDLNPTCYDAPEEPLAESPPARVPVPRLKLGGRAAPAEAAAAGSAVAATVGDRGAGVPSLPSHDPPTASDEPHPPAEQQVCMLQS